MHRARETSYVYADCPVVEKRVVISWDLQAEGDSPSGVTTEVKCSRHRGCPIAFADNFETPPPCIACKATASEKLPLQPKQQWVERRRMSRRIGDHH